MNSVPANLFQYKIPVPQGQVRAYRLGHKQILWNAGVMEYWNIGFDGSRQPLLDGFGPEKPYPLFITHYSIIPIFH